MERFWVGFQILHGKLLQVLCFHACFGGKKKPNPISTAPAKSAISELSETQPLVEFSPAAQVIPFGPF